MYHNGSNPDLQNQTPPIQQHPQNSQLRDAQRGMYFAQQSVQQHPQYSSLHHQPAAQNFSAMAYTNQRHLQQQHSQEGPNPQYNSYVMSEHLNTTQEQSAMETESQSVQSQDEQYSLATNFPTEDATMQQQQHQLPDQQMQQQSTITHQPSPLTRSIATPRDSTLPASVQQVSARLTPDARADANALAANSENITPNPLVTSETDPWASMRKVILGDVRRTMGAHIKAICARAHILTRERQRREHGTEVGTFAENLPTTSREIDQYFADNPDLHFWNNGIGSANVSTADDDIIEVSRESDSAGDGRLLNAADVADKRAAQSDTSASPLEPQQHQPRSVDETDGGGAATSLDVASPIDDSDFPFLEQLPSSGGNGGGARNDSWFGSAEHSTNTRNQFINACSNAERFFNTMHELTKQLGRIESTYLADYPREYTQCNVAQLQEKFIVDKRHNIECVQKSIEFVSKLLERNAPLDPITNSPLPLSDTNNDDSDDDDAIPIEGGEQNDIFHISDNINIIQFENDHSGRARRLAAVEAQASDSEAFTQTFASNMDTSTIPTPGLAPGSLSTPATSSVLTKTETPAAGMVNPTAFTMERLMTPSSMALGYSTPAISSAMSFPVAASVATSAPQTLASLLTGDMSSLKSASFAPSFK